MTNHTIDNSARDLGKVVLWQYDKAYNLLLVLDILRLYYDAAIKSFWDRWPVEVLDVRSCTEFGAMVWGSILGIRRPTIKDTSTGAYRAINLETYRRLLRASFYGFKANCSHYDILQYMKILFSASDDDSVCGVSLYDHADMSITYEPNEHYNEMDADQRAIFEQLGDEYLIYPLGIKQNTAVENFVFGLKGADKDSPVMEFSEGESFEAGDIVSHRDEEKGILLYRCVRSFSDLEWDEAKQFVTPVLNSNVRLYGGFSHDIDVESYKQFVAYQKGAFVSHDGSVYLCTDSVPEDANTDWQTVKYNFSETYRNVTLSSLRRID